MSKLTRATYHALDAVREFHELNGQVVNLSPPPEPVPTRTAVLRIRLILEEASETVIAIHEGNLIETADGLADLLYVILGTAVSFGVPVEDMFMVSEDHGLKLPQDREVLAFVKALTVGVSEVTEALQGCSPCGCPDLECRGKTVGQEDYEKLQEILHTLAKFVCGAGAAWGIPLQEVFQEVHRANLSKKLGGARDGLKYGEGGGKGEGYTPPDVAGILKAHER